MDDVSLQAKGRGWKGREGCGTGEKWEKIREGGKRGIRREEEDYREVEGRIRRQGSDNG